MDLYTVGQFVRIVFEKAGPGAGMGLVGGLMLWAYMKERRAENKAEREARSAETGALVVELGKARDALQAANASTIIVLTNHLKHSSEELKEFSSFQNGVVKAMEASNRIQEAQTKALDDLRREIRERS